MKIRFTKAWWNGWPPGNPSSMKAPAAAWSMMEIDGLSYHHIQKALAEGYLPTCKR